MNKSLLTFLAILLSLSSLRAQQPIQDATQLPSQPPAPQGQQGWVQLNSGTTEWLHGLFALSRDTVWSRGAVPLRTSDGGQHWLQRPRTGGVESLLFVLDDTTLFASKGDSIAKSTDGGATWGPPIWTGVQGGAGVVVCPSRDTCYALGDIEVARTYNGGKTWTAQQQPAHMNNLAFADARHGFIVTPVITWNRDSQGNPRQQSAEFAYTSDAGVSWKHNYSGISQNLYGVFAFDDSSAIAVGERGLIVMTTDRGLSYRLIDSAGDRAYSRVFFISHQEGWVIGYEGEILQTADGGQTWVSEQSGVTSRLSAIQFVDDSIGFVTGVNGVILKTTNAGTQWVQTSPPSAQDLHLQTFYDPETPMINLAYSLPQPQNVTAIIYNMMGKQIATLANGELQQAGKQRLIFNCSPLPSGTYLCTITTNRYHAAGKFEVTH